MKLINGRYVIGRIYKFLKNVSVYKLKLGGDRVKATSLISEELIFNNFDADSFESLISIVGYKLVDKGYVYDSFIPAIVKREKEYPTGLMLNDFRVAIPHTDHIHIKKPFIAVVKNNQEIPIVQMGTDSDQMNVRHFFILGIKNPEEQVPLLQSLIDNFNDASFVEMMKEDMEKNKIFKYLLEKM